MIVAAASVYVYTMSDSRYTWTKRVHFITHNKVKKNVLFICIQICNTIKPMKSKIYANSHVRVVTITFNWHKQKYVLA